MPRCAQRASGAEFALRLPQCRTILVIIRNPAFLFSFAPLVSFAEKSFYWRWGALQAVRTVQLGEIPIEGAERQMTGFAGNFQNETIGETQ